MCNPQKYTDCSVWWYMMLAKHRVSETDWEDIEDVFKQAEKVIDMFENDPELEHYHYFADFLAKENPLYIKRQL